MAELARWNSNRFTQRDFFIRSVTNHCWISMYKTLCATMYKHRVDHTDLQMSSRAFQMLKFIAKILISGVIPSPWASNKSSSFFLGHCLLSYGILILTFSSTFFIPNAFVNHRFLYPPLKLQSLIFLRTDAILIMSHILTVITELPVAVWNCITLSLLTLFLKVLFQNHCHVTGLLYGLASPLQTITFILAKEIFIFIRGTRSEPVTLPVVNCL